MTLLAYSMTAAPVTPLNPATSAADVVANIAIPANHHPLLEIVFDVKITQTATSAAQTLTFNIRDGTTVLQAITYNTTAIAKHDIIALKAILALQKGSSNLNLSLGVAAGADAQTTVQCLSYKVEGQNLQTT